MKDYQNGFRTQSALEHERIIQTIGQYHEKTTEAMSAVLGEVRLWRHEAVAITQILEKEAIGED